MPAPEIISVLLFFRDADADAVELHTLIDIDEQVLCAAEHARLHEVLPVRIHADDDIRRAVLQLGRAEQAGLLVLTAKTRIRLLPPLILTQEDVDKALAILRTVLEKL